MRRFLPMLAAALAGCATAPTHPAPAATAPAAPDRSLAAQNYLEEGLPAVDRPWTPAEYESAVRVLTPVAAKDPAQLPRFGSSRSGAVFERFCAVENLAPLSDSSASAVARLQTGSDYLKGALGLMRLYYQATVATRGYATELVSLMGLALHLSTLMAEIGAQVPPPEEEPRRSAYEQGRVQMTSGFGSVAEGCLQSVDEKDLYSEADRIRLTQFLQADLPRLFPYLPLQSRKLIPSKIKRMAAEEESASLRSALEALGASLPKVPASGPG